MKFKIFLTAGMCFAIGVFLITQSGITEGQSLFVSAKAVNEFVASIESEVREIDNIRDRIRETEDMLAKYEAAKENDDFSEISEELAAELVKYRMFSGFETVRGAGVKVTIDDGTRPLFEGEDINVILVHDIDIIIVINDLKRSGAEAISVNGQRVVGTTEISCSGYTVRINGQVFARPFVIRAIGDGRRLSSSLLSTGGYGALLKDFGVLFTVELLEDIIIPGHTGIFDYLYMADIKEV